MDTIEGLAKILLELTFKQPMLVVCLVAMGVVGFALYVVLQAIWQLRCSSTKRE